MSALLPFTAAQFFEVFARYNEAVWPAQIAAYGAGALAVGAVLAGGAINSRIAVGVLAAFWLWTGVAYHWFAFAEINRAAWLFGALFVAESAALFWLGVYRGVVMIGPPRGLAALTGLLFVTYAAVLYPGLGHVLGHYYPHVPVFGITPCPVTIFTFGIFLLARAVPKELVVIPVLWSLVGGTAAFLLNVPQDWMLLLGGPLALALLWPRLR